jgi:molecular chaperone Hsp33
MADYIIRAEGDNYHVRAFVAITTELTETARQHHQTTPVATAALGRLLTAGAMMGVMMKGSEDLLTLQIKGNGPLGGIIVTANAKGEVKGYVHQPQIDLPLKANGKLDVSGAIGEGMLQIIRDIGLKDPYIGQTELISGEIAEDITYYYASSEQTPSVVALGVLVDRDYSVKQSGGFILQLMPEASEDTITILEMNIKDLPSMTQMLEMGLTGEEILMRLLNGLEAKILDNLPTKFVCDCKKERVERALISLGTKELQEMIDDGEEIELACQFCNKNYHFSVEELCDIKEQISK